MFTNKNFWHQNLPPKLDLAYLWIGSFMSTYLILFKTTHTSCIYSCVSPSKNKLTLEYHEKWIVCAVSIDKPHMKIKTYGHFKDRFIHW